jgi:hypothetical protein
MPYFENLSDETSIVNFPLSSAAQLRYAAQDINLEMKMPAFRTLDDVDVHGKKVVIRLDLNVPIANGKVPIKLALIV